MKKKRSLKADDVIKFRTNVLGNNAYCGIVREIHQFSQKPLVDIVYLLDVFTDGCLVARNITVSIDDLDYTKIEKPNHTIRSLIEAINSEAKVLQTKLNRCSDALSFLKNIKQK